MDSKSRNTKIIKRCRQCRSEKISYRMYGLPGPGVEKELSKEFYHVEIMGCCVAGEIFEFHCLECDFEWNPPYSEDD